MLYHDTMFFHIIGECNYGLSQFDTYLKVLPLVRQTPDGSVWLHYDTEADTLYVNFQKPSRADDRELTGDDMIIRCDEHGQVIGCTILHAQSR